MHEFIITGEYIQLIQLLKASGLCGTGGHAKMVVEEGEVKVNGEDESRKRRKLVDGDIVYLDGQEIRIKAQQT